MLKNPIFAAFALYTLSLSQNIKVLVWTSKGNTKAYPDGIHKVVAEFLNADDKIEAVAVRDDESKLSDASLSAYQTLFICHSSGISKANQTAIADRVRKGELGFVGTHDTMRDNEILRDLTGMTKMYTDYMDKIVIRVAKPDHPIAEGVDPEFTLDPGQPYITFTVSNDIELIFTGNSTKDENLKVAFTRNPEKGRVFYFAPDHETYNSYSNKNVQKILTNAAHWVVVDTAGNNPVGLTREHNSLIGFTNAFSKTTFFKEWNPNAAIYTIDGKRGNTERFPAPGHYFIRNYPGKNTPVKPITPAK